MSDSSSILEYASPRLKHPFRLPTRSTVRVERTETGAVVTEVIAAKEGSVFAIAFACFILLIYLLAIVAYVRGEQNQLINGLTAIIGVFWFCYAGLLLWVINETWTTTVLRVEPNVVHLMFRSPFQRHNVDWPIDQIADVSTRRVRLVDLPDTFDSGRRMAGEIVFTIRNARPVPLFSGHRLDNVQSLCYGIRQVLWPAPKR